MSPPSRFSLANRPLTWSPVTESNRRPSPYHLKVKAIVGASGNSEVFGSFGGHVRSVSFSAVLETGGDIVAASMAEMQHRWSEGVQIAYLSTVA